jgi:GT2 family glycosyltransferase
MASLRPFGHSEPVCLAIPTKNRPDYLAVLLASIVAQSYRHWSLVINDDSDSPVEDVPVIRDLLDGIRARGHWTSVVRGASGSRRHQVALEAVPSHIEFVVRVDDDVFLHPDYLEHVLRPFRIFADVPLAAVGGTLPQPHLALQDLEQRLAEPGWIPTVDQPTWKLQGHSYRQDEILEVESLLGHSIAYRRSAVEVVGGWAVEGYSPHAQCEESDLCSRLRAAGYQLMVTTRARAWHLYSPGGGSREVLKTSRGVFLTSDVSPLQQDGRLFAERLAQLRLRGLKEQPLRRFRIAELEAGLTTPLPLQTTWGRIKHQVSVWRGKWRLRSRWRALLSRLGRD